MTRRQSVQSWPEERAARRSSRVIGAENSDSIARPIALSEVECGGITHSLAISASRFAADGDRTTIRSATSQSALRMRNVVDGSLAFSSRRQSKQLEPLQALAAEDQPPTKTLSLSCQISTDPDAPSNTTEWPMDDALTPAFAISHGRHTAAKTMTHGALKRPPTS